MPAVRRHPELLLGARPQAIGVHEFSDAFLTCPDLAPRKLPPAARSLWRYGERALRASDHRLATLRGGTRPDFGQPVKIILAFDINDI